MLVLIVTAILVPTACLLWLANVAVQNEQLAVRQRLIDIYTQQLAAVRRNFTGDLRARLDVLADPRHHSAPILFALVVRPRVADSLLVLNADGTVAYPTAAPVAAADVPHPAKWDDVQQLEYSDPAAAADEWKSLAAELNDPNWRATALRNEARALASSHQVAAAIDIFSVQLQDSRGEIDPTSTSRNLLAPAALVRALQLKTENPGVRTEISSDQIAGEALDWLERYDTPLISSPQRLFLLQQFQQVTGNTSLFLSAEQLAAPFVEDPGRRPLPAFQKAGLYRLGECYVLASAGDERTALALFRPQTMDALLAAAAAKASLAPGIHIRLLPNSLSAPPNRLAEVSDDLFPDFRLSIVSDAPDLFAATASRQRSLYLWTAALTIAATLALGLLLAYYTSRQLRLARLKNDLIATVSHELKTPLASMRLLVETLLEHRTTSPQQSDEYLALISRENGRLSRLIDNFLTFSRMERNKRRFEFSTVNLAEIIDHTLAALPERAAAITTRIDAGPDDPLLLRADPEALITLLSNLLDNAWKYSNSTGEGRKIGIHACRRNSQIVLSVSDNGIGIPRRYQKKIFKRFFQIDQSLSRKVGGTGLGLSIVQFIAAAHHASVSVESTQGKGSTFTVAFPEKQESRSKKQEVRMSIPLLDS
ncbi:MAG: sensor histidine kinase [Phycisphaerae bacterium]